MPDVMRTLWLAFERISYRWRWGVVCWSAIARGDKLGGLGWAVAPPAGTRAVLCKLAIFKHFKCNSKHIKTIFIGSLKRNLRKWFLIQMNMTFPKEIMSNLMFSYKGKKSVNLFAIQLPVFKGIIFRKVRDCLPYS